MLSTDEKLLAVYDDLLEKIQEISEADRAAPAGKDGKDAPDRGPQLFAAIAALHSDLVKKLVESQRDIVCSPEIVVNSGERVYEVERDSRGLLTKIRSKPVSGI